MAVQIKVDQQGRIVIPLVERERLGVAKGGTLELIPTSEGVLLERRRPASIRTANDGLPIVTLDDVEQVSNEESIDAIHEERERR